MWSMDAGPTGCSSCNSWLLECWLSSCFAWAWLLHIARGDLPRSGMEPVSPAFVGGFFITEPPEKPHMPFKIVNWEIDASVIKMCSKIKFCATSSLHHGGCISVQIIQWIIELSVHVKCAPGFGGGVLIVRKKLQHCDCLSPATTEPTKYSSSGTLGRSGKEKRILTMSLL